MKKTLQLLALIMTLIMALTCVPAFAESKALEDYEDVMVMSSYIGTGTAEPMDQPNNELVKFVMKKFNIDIADTEFLSGDFLQRLGLMIASGDMPDVVAGYRSNEFNELINQFAEAGMIIETEELLRNSPNIMQDLNESMIDYFRSEDGKLYCIPSYGINPDNTEAQYSSEPNLTWFKRTDLFESLGLEDPETPEDLYNILVTMKENVQTVDGSEFIPLQACDASVYEQMVGAMFGIYTHRYEMNEEEQRFTDLEEFPEYLEFLKYMAKLYREGLLDPELFLTEQPVAISRQREARIGIGITWPNDIDVLEQAANLVDPAAKYNAFRMPRVEGLENTQYWQTGTMPTLVAIISADAEDPERIMKYLDWQCSVEGWLAMCYGAPIYEEGVQSCWWEENGEYYYSQELRDAYTSVDPLYENQVLGGWTYFLTGRYIYHMHHQGFANVTESPDAQRMEAREYNLPEVFMDTAWDIVDGIPDGEVEQVKGIAVDKVFNDGYQKIIMEAQSDAEVEDMYNQMMEDAIAAGLRDIQKEEYARYQMHLNGEL